MNIPVFGLEEEAGVTTLIIRTQDLKEEIRPLIRALQNPVSRRSLRRAIRMGRSGPARSESYPF